MAARWTIERAQAEDAKDPLAGLRNRFILPEGIIYLDGNSLGPLPVDVAAGVRSSIEDQWGIDLARGWDHCGWMQAPEVIGDRIATLIGANSGEVLVADTTSVALAKLVGAVLQARPWRRVVLTSTDNFPSDLYAMDQVTRAAGGELRVVDRTDLTANLNDQMALCCLTHVDFRTGERHDLAGLTSAVHDVGALVLWDLCHSVGAMPVDCEEHGVDLAVGCTYKYLNGGPGSPAFLYVRRDLQSELENPLPGWLGHAEPFSFSTQWHPTSGIRRFLTSTPPVIALAALDRALDAFDGVSMHSIREKSLALSQLFIDVIDDARIAALEVASPGQAERRGSQVALRHPQAAALVAAAAAGGVIGDVRPPDLARFGFGPLYLRFSDVFRAAEIVIAAARSLDS